MELVEEVEGLLDYFYPVRDRGSNGVKTAPFSKEFVQ